MKLIYTSSNAADHVLLVQDSTEGEFVRSAWEVDAKTFRNFCDCTQDPNDWDEQFLAGSVEDYGDVVAERVGFELHSIDRNAWERRVAFFGNAK